VTGDRRDAKDVGGDGAGNCTRGRARSQRIANDSGVDGLADWSCIFPLDAYRLGEMLPQRQGSIHLFRLLGIDVFLHWSWFLLALWGISNQVGGYRSNIWLWSALQYVALFLIVLMHEFGHSLACKSVGGQADQIVLWPLGGVAFVSPPQRPGATLWSIAAGPLVNVVLFPILTALMYVARATHWPATIPDAYLFVRNIWYINFGLLIFNLLPIYPLDGGQILRSLLWFVFGRANSLLIAAGIGLLGVVAVGVFALIDRSAWLGLIAVFILFQCWNGLRQARALARVAKAPPRLGFACPSCGAVPPTGAFWICGKCRQSFDIFAIGGVCPNCGSHYNATRCLECGVLHPIDSFQTHARV
jgi:Zn-dependent protease